MKSQKQKQREAQEERQLQLETLAYVEALANPRYVAEAAGFWLNRLAPPQMRAAA